MPIKGTISLPGDKSISHRMLMLSSLTKGTNIIKNLSTGLDVESTRKCLLACGIKSTKIENKVLISGKLKHPNIPLDCGNSGTSVRLLSGLLAGQKINANFIGDKSLSSRPMNRIIKPLKTMGAIINSSKDSLPIKLKTNQLIGIDYQSSISSAQIKSCIIFAGLGANSITKFTETEKSRDHTEIALDYLNADISKDGLSIIVKPLSYSLESFKVIIPGDPSSAAFFIAAALIVPNSELVIENLSLNPTRIGFIKILKKMGAMISIIKKWNECGEIVGNLLIKYSILNSITIEKGDIPSLIDELPIFSLLATQADGITEVKGAQELRVKETDRINAICSNLKKMNAKIIEMKDGFIIEGPTRLKGCNINTFNDHRIAMTFIIANLISDKSVILDNSDCINISFPEFNFMLNSICK